MTTLDYETRSRIHLERPKNRGAAVVLANPLKCGLHNYATDPSTRMLCAGIDDALYVDGLETHRFLLTAGPLHAHNAGFERNITRYVLGLDVPPERWRCTAARARHAHVPGNLEGACRALGVTEQKDMEGHAIMRKLCAPNPKAGKKVVTQTALWKKVTKKLLKENPDSTMTLGERYQVRPEISYIEPEWIDDLEMFDRLYSYCKQDVAAERALAAALPPLPDSEQKIWEFDRRVNERGFPVDLDFCRGACQILAEAFDENQKRVAKLTSGLITRGMQTRRIKQWVNERGVNVDDLQAETVDTLLQHEGLHPDVKALLHLRQSVSSAAIGKYSCALDLASVDWRIREGLMYYGASATGRWTGPGFNPLNMKKGITLDEQMIEDASAGDYGMFVAMYGDRAIELLGSSIRGIICAPSGKSFVDADSSQIELRIVHWLAGDDGMLDTIRAGFDPYVAGYSKMYGVPPASVTKDMRQKGKVLGLGMQYAMGAGRLMEVTGFDRARAVLLIGVYRKANPEIAAMWDRLTQAAILAITRQAPVRVGRLVFELESVGKNAWLTMLLPSGRRIYYLRPSVVENKHGFPAVQFESPNKGRHTIGGGHLLENAAQAICRDLLCGWMLDMERAGMEVLFNVYDSILVETDADASPSVKTEVERIMTSAPEWADGLPLGVGADVKKRFEK